MHVKLLEDAIAVKEVVAIGYSTIRKEELTSSVTRVDASDFNGVIIIETKSAEVGRANIEYTSYYYTEHVARKLDMMSADQYLDYLERHGQSTANNDYGFSTDWTDELLRSNFSYYQGVSFSRPAARTRRCAHRSATAIRRVWCSARAMSSSPAASTSVRISSTAC